MSHRNKKNFVDKRNATSFRLYLSNIFRFYDVGKIGSYHKASMSLENLIDEYLWGRIDESEYLKRVVEEKNVDTDTFLSIVKEKQADLNTQLRKGVCFFI
jgi:hypothetical protein